MSAKSPKNMVIAPDKLVWHLLHISTRTFCIWVKALCKHGLPPLVILLGNNWAELYLFCTYHSLMRLFKENLWILKEHFSYLWKIWTLIANSFGEIFFEKLESLQRIFELINVFASQQFRSFLLLMFPFSLIAKSWKLCKPLKLSSSLTFEPNLYTRRRLLWVNSYVNEPKMKTMTSARIRILSLVCSACKILNTHKSKAKENTELHVRVRVKKP